MEKKLKKEAKKGKKNEVSVVGIGEAECGGKVGVVEGGKSLEREDMKGRRGFERGDNEGKRKKRKKKKAGENSSREGLGSEKVNEEGEGIGEFGDGGGDAEVIESGKSLGKEDARGRRNDGRGDNAGKKRKKKKKAREDGSKGDEVSEKVNEEGEQVRELGGGEELDRSARQKVERKKKKREKDKIVGDSGLQLQKKGFQVVKVEGSQTVNGAGNEMQNKEEIEAAGRGSNGEVVEKAEKKKGNREKKKRIVDSGASQEDTADLAKSSREEIGYQNRKGFELDEGCTRDSLEKADKKRKREKEKTINTSGVSKSAIPAEDSNPGNANSTMDKKEDSKKKNGNDKGKRKRSKIVENGCRDTTVEKTKKKVTFSGHVEVFPPSGAGKGEEKLVRGKRFSKEENEILKKAVYDYIESQCLGEEGLDMVLNCQSYPKVRNCWKEIATALPHRPQDAVYYRAHLLLKRKSSGRRKWTKEEKEMIKKYQEEHGNKWKDLAEELGAHRFDVKDTWRRIRYTKLNKGRWSQEEYQHLFDSVNTDLKMKYSEEKKSKHGMLRDNIPWGAISDTLSSRTDAACCLKWYNQLTSSMVADGEWADSDDYRLLNALYEVDASCIEDVNWDYLLDHRSGDVCRKRWSQMVLHIGFHGSKTFSEQVEVLARRYQPDLLEARDAWDSKPRVP